jgi:hypothetical protein
MPWKRAAHREEVQQGEEECSKMRRKREEWGGMQQGEEECSRVKRRVAGWGEVWHDEEEWSRVWRSGAGWGEMQQVRRSAEEWGGDSYLKEEMLFWDIVRVSWAEKLLRQYFRKPCIPPPTPSNSCPRPLLPPSLHFRPFQELY